jgi:LmbE family N-acetylglucosaminyl deacetylase
MAATPGSGKSRRVLAIGAHPDDVEFLCAGTLVLLHEAGWRVHVATMSPGDLGSATLDREAIAALRREEARRSAEMIKASYTCLEARDFQIFFGDELLRRTTALVRSVDPDLVITHAPADYLADHEETSRLVRHACFAAPVKLYAIDDEHPPTRAIPHLYCCDPIELIDSSGEVVAAEFAVDVAPAMRMKELMLGCHSSQREWMRRQHGEDDYVATMKRWSAERGRPHGFEFAEGFRQHRGHAFPRTPLLQESVRSSARPGA